MLQSLIETYDGNFLSQDFRFNFPSDRVGIASVGDDKQECFSYKRRLKDQQTREKKNHLSRKRLAITYK